MPDIDNTRIYLGKSEVAKLLGVHEQTVHALEREEDLLEPDVIIGLSMSDNGQQFSGYDRDRVIEYGKATGRLDADGRPLSRIRGTGQVHATRPVPKDERDRYPAWWYAEVRYLLSRADLPVVWGLKPRSVTMRAQRKQMPHADVALNTTMKRGVTYGYDPANIGRRSQQLGLSIVVDPAPYLERAVQRQS